MGLETTAALLVAASDLKVVRLLRDAINSGLPKTGPLGTIPPGANPATPRPHVKFRGAADVRFTPRPVVHPTPRFEPRPVIHPSPRVVDVPPIYAAMPPVESSSIKILPFPPVWATLPPVACDPGVIVVKNYLQKVEVVAKGTLLDQFA